MSNSIPVPKLDLSKILAYREVGVVSPICDVSFESGDNQIELFMSKKVVAVISFNLATTLLFCIISSIAIPILAW
jgi:hypothetical protein